MNNLESNDSSLGAGAKRLKITISERMHIPLMFSIINAVIISSPGTINQLRVIRKPKIV